MLIGRILTKLRSLQDAVAKQAKIYLFGSALRANRISDVDIAIVTDDPEAIGLIQAEISSDHDLQIVDLTVLSSREERELNFIKTVGAIKVTNIQ